MDICYVFPSRHIDYRMENSNSSHTGATAVVSNKNLILCTTHLSQKLWALRAVWIQFPVGFSTYGC